MSHAGIVSKRLKISSDFFLGLVETRMMGLPVGRKSFKIGLGVLIQYRRVTASQPATQPATLP